MYVLADLEWVENKDKRISFSQIAMIRVNENWKLFLIAHAGQQHPDAEFTDVFFNESEGNYYFEFIGEQYMQAEFPRSFYDKIAEE